MRKLVVLCLAVGLALASSEQWVGRSQNSYYTISDPQPGIFPSSPMLFLDATDTLKYDDNMPNQSWYWFEGGNGWGMKFVPPSDNVTLAGALVYLGTNSPGGNQAAVRVYADDGVNGSPGTELFTDTATITMGQWNFVSVSIPIVASNFYIFYVQVGDSANAPTLACDAGNNAPAHRKWRLAGGFSEDRTQGDWLIRAVLDWTPQDTNASAVWFATNMTTDTLPNINYPVRAYIKNMGSSVLPIGTPVRLRITGPNSYEYQDTVATVGALNHGAAALMNFTPVWHIPNEPGDYSIKVWTEAAGEMYPADDTIAWELSCAKWMEYFTEAKMYWISSNGPDKAVLFDPVDFGLQYPVGLQRVRAEFYLHPQLPWSDTSFQFLIYGDDGATLLYESETLEAPTGMPGAPIAHTLDSTLTFASGTFYVAVASVRGDGRPTLFSDSCATVDHSYYGSAMGGWNQYGSGEWFISAALQADVGVEEGFEAGLASPSLRVTNYPNPVTDQVTLKWQVPSRTPVSVNLYDATGRVVRNLLAANEGARVGTLTMDTKSLAAGIYLVRLETAKGSATRKLVIDR